LVALPCVLLVLAGCASSTGPRARGECPRVELIPLPLEAAARAASCTATLIWEGRPYHQWCVEVKKSKLAEVLGRADQGFVARGLVGVETQAAIAVATTGSDGRPVQGARCGTWRFTPTSELSRATAEQLGRTVTVSGGIGE
jgi:hypothetical protein